MIHSGLVSVRFRKCSPAAIVALVKEAGPKAIERGGGIHGPSDDRGRARKVRGPTLKNGLSVAAFGRYHRAGQSESAGLSFELVLATAGEFGAPAIRVWPGGTGLEQTVEDGRCKIARGLRRIADFAARAVAGISREYDGGPLTATHESASRFLFEIGHPNVFINWQPPRGEETAECVRGLSGMPPQVRNVHVFHRRPTSAERHPLANGSARWTNILSLLQQAPGDRFALLESVPGDDAAAFLRGAATWKAWLACS